MACLVLSRAWKQGAGMVPPQAESDASRPERSFATPGQNERPCEKQDKTAAREYIVLEIISLF